MEIKGTQKIKSIVDLSSLKQQVKKGQVLHISDNEFHNNDVQIAIKMGLVEVIAAPKTAEEEFDDFGAPFENEVDRAVVCKNLLPRPLSLPGVKEQILPLQTFNMRESQLNNANIRAAIAKRLMRVIKIVGAEEDVNEVEINVSKSLNKSFSTITDNSQHISDNLLNTEIKDSPTQNLDTNEEIIKKPKIKNTPKKSSSNKTEKVTEQNIKIFSNGVTIANPNHSPITNTVKTAKIWDPKKNGEIDFVDQKVNDEKLSFVDQEEKDKKIKEHPILSKKVAKNNEEIDFVG